VEALLRLSGTDPFFFFGAHVGEGGLIMDNTSKVIGNVFSNGDIIGDPGAVITDTATVADSGSILRNIEVQGDAHVDECESADIAVTLHNNTNTGCTFGSYVSLGTPPDPVPLPITTEQIQEWKDEAEAGGVISGDFVLAATNTATLGPQKIEGNLTVQDQAQLTLAGTLWVTGNVSVKNKAQVRLDPSFGIGSSLMVTDGIIVLENESASQGSGSEGSYLMYLSTNTGSSALQVKDSATVDIVYTSVGGVSIENTADIKEVTGYQVHLKNSAEVTFESGLSSATFVSGSEGGWELMSWKEVE